MLNRPLLIALLYLVNPLLVSVSLAGCVWYYLDQFDEIYFALLLLSFLLALYLVDRVDVDSNNKTFWAKTVVALTLQWGWEISLLLLIGFATKLTEFYSRKVLLIWFLVTPGVLVMANWMLRCLLYRGAIFVDDTCRAVIVGINDLSRKLANEFELNPLLGITCLGFFDDRKHERLPEPSHRHPEAPISSLKSVAQFVKVHNVQKIFITLPMTANSRIVSLLDQLTDTTASIYFVPDIFVFDLIQANVSTIRDIPVLTVCESPFVGVNGAIKQILDLGLSISILVIAAPVMVLIAIGVKLSSPGPVLYKQRRYGLDGKEIIVYKFRTMTVMDEGGQVEAQATRNDPRITRFGCFLRKTSFDELPQFINVLQGHMSVVGPRPHAVSHNEMYRSLIKGYMIRHKVKPGITGWAQIKGFRGETETIEKMQARIDHDLDYLRNWSLFLELFIIFKTFGVLFGDKNAY
jgi:putative colanic acid biosysnthesis UDP-glucose lipid carrier transferase